MRVRARGCWRAALHKHCTAGGAPVLLPPAPQFTQRATCYDMALERDYPRYTARDRDECRSRVPRVDPGIAYWVYVPGNLEDTRRALAHSGGRSAPQASGGRKRQTHLRRARCWLDAACSASTHPPAPAEPRAPPAVAPRSCVSGAHDRA